LTLPLGLVGGEPNTAIHGAAMEFREIVVGAWGASARLRT
jgi:hypothetical protein